MPRITHDDLERRIWAWLPARPDRRRVTLPHVIAAALDTPLGEVQAALERMERAGYVVRDQAAGRRAYSWHRGHPIPEPPTHQHRQETLC
ncbi:MAG TPA: hypothetical protein VIL00_05775 [Pseudonocardiaceae bacterium]